MINWHESLHVYISVTIKSKIVYIDQLRIYLYWFVTEFAYTTGTIVTLTLKTGYSRRFE